MKRGDQVKVRGINGLCTVKHVYATAVIVTKPDGRSIAVQRSICEVVQ